MQTGLEEERRKTEELEEHEMPAEEHGEQAQASQRARKRKRRGGEYTEAWGGGEYTEHRHTNNIRTRGGG